MLLYLEVCPCIGISSMYLVVNILDDNQILCALTTKGKNSCGGIYFIYTGTFSKKS